MCHKSTPFHIVKNAIYTTYTILPYALQSELSRQRERQKAIGLGGVYMRKFTPGRVSYRDDFLISYRVYMMTGSFHISLFEGTLHVDKVQV